MSSYLISMPKTDNNLRTSFLLVVSSKEIPTRSSSIKRILIDSFKALKKKSIRHMICMNNYSIKKFIRINFEFCFNRLC